MPDSTGSLASAVVSRALIVGLGKEGLEVARALRRRLNERVGTNLPMIRYLILADKGTLAQPGLEPDDEYLVYLPLEWKPGDLGQVRQLADVDAWLPDADQRTLDNLGQRATARLCLIKHYTQIQETVRRLLLAIATPTGIGAGEEKTQVEQRRQQPSTYFYLIASLANPLAGGLVVDLAYLLGQAIRPVQDEAIPDVDAGVFRFVNGVLLLPGFREGSTANVQDRLVRTAGEPGHLLEQERMAQAQEQANAYAAMLELDHYMSQKYAYTCEFRHQDGPLVVPAGYRPFWEGHCFLLGPAIERSQRANPEYRIGWLTDVGVAVAESLYQRLAAPAAGFLEPVQRERAYGGRVSAYASFGVSAEVLPWRDLRDYCTYRLSSDISGALLRAEDAPEPEEAENFLKRIPVTPDSLRRSLAQDSGWAANLQRDNRPRPRLDRIPWFDARTTEAALMRDDHRWRRDLTEVDGKLVENAEGILAGAGVRIRQEFKRMLDSQPAGGLHRAINLAQEIRRLVKQEHQQETQRLEGLKSALWAANGQVGQARGRYFLATGALGHMFAAPALILVVLTLLSIGAIIVIGEALGQLVLAWLAAIVSLGFAGVVYAGLGLWSMTARTAFSEAYRQRQVAEREMTEQERLVELYGLLDNTLVDLVRRLTDFRRMLLKVKEKRERASQDRDLQYRLYEKPSFVLEKSVLTPAMVEQFYAEVTQLGPASMAAELSSPTFGPYSHWVFSGHQEADLVADLNRYAAQRVAPLQRHSVLELLNRLPDPFLNQRMMTLRDLAQPMWDLDPLEPEPELQRVTSVEAGGKESRPMALLNQLCPHNHRPLDVSSPHYLTHTSIRWGAPLYAIEGVRRCRDAYDQLVSRGHLAELHTTREHQALADLLPWRTEDPRTIFALGRAFALIEQDQTDSSFYFLYQTRRDLDLARAAGRPSADRKAVLGRTKQEACRKLTIHKEWYALAEARMHETVWENVQGEFGGDPLKLAFALNKYSTETPDLAAWERDVLLAYVEKLYRSPLVQPQPPADLDGQLTAQARFLTLSSAPAPPSSTAAPAAGGVP